MSLRGSRRNAKLPCDLIVRTPSGDQLDHLTLPIRDHRRPLVEDCDHAGDANNGHASRLLIGRRNFSPTPLGVDPPLLANTWPAYASRVIVCPRCGQENPAGARFCNACSAPLEQAAAPAREERKVVTVLFADLVGFTARAEQLDPEDVRGLLAPYHAYMREELERFGGTVEKFIGDAVVAVFGAPTAPEDDPERAVRAAPAIRDWVTQEGNELQLRVAVNTGEALIALGVRPSEGEGMASGDVINTAARLQSTAPVNGILVGEPTYRATRHVIAYREADPVEAKGKAQRIVVWEALEARSRVVVALGDAKAALVGRERELSRLRDALDVARRQRQLQLVTLVGVPGIGKSRPVQELFKVGEGEPDFTTWRQGRSLPYGEGVSFWALA